MFFDLDPGEGVAWRDVKAAALEVRQILTAFGLTPYVKTSGKKGMHVVVPIEPKLGWKELHAASGRIAAHIAVRYPQTFTTNMAKRERVRRIFVDFHRNARTSTAVGAYSLRAVAGLPASTPIAWDDLGSIDAPGDLNYATVPGFLRNANDPWADMDESAAVLDTRVLRVSE
jgi:bifunctional non-homologous end joining protein LigD